MSIINNGLLLASGADAAVGYQISRSLRFNSADSAYLNRTPASAGNRKTWTWSSWIKLSKITASGQGTTLFDATAGTTNANMINFMDADELRFILGNGTAELKTTQLFRDVSAWYHIVAVLDTTVSSPSSDRMKLYVNGTRVTNFNIAAYPSQNAEFAFNNNVLHEIGRINYSGVQYGYFNGYMADIWFLDGIAATPSDFAETDATTGQWVPKAYTGSYGTNGFRLTFSDNSGTTSTTLGKDAAGSNNWTPNNFSVASGSGNDSLVDSPSSYGTDTGAGGEVRGNYATLNPLNSGGSITLANGNLDVTRSSNTTRVHSTIAVSSGKWYVEMTSGGDSMPGISLASATPTNYPGGDSGTYGYNQNGNKYTGGTDTSYGASFTTGDVIGIALNLDAGTLVFYKNGVSQGTAYSSLSGTFVFAARGSNSATAEVWNFGQRAFAYTAPSGFKALVDTNLTAPTIAKPNTVMDVKLYTGNGSTQNITGLGFNPDLVWLKIRNTAGSHGLWDAIRGTGARLDSGSTGAEDSTVGVTAFNSDGFTVGGPYNSSSNTWAAWCWDAGTSTVTNNNGSISSQVRANQNSGFSIVTFTSNASGNATVGHGLGVAPSLVILKNRTGGAGNWLVFHKAVCTKDNFLYLNSTNALGTYTDVQGAAIPSSTVFGINAGIGIAGSADCVAYCFAPVSGYSSFGSYTGTSTSDGSFVYCGFRPRFVLIKNTDGSSPSGIYNWVMYDSARSTYNVNETTLYSNTSDQENTTNGTYNPNNKIDFLSNGFKIRGNSWQINRDGSATYIYAAFAENPFQYARAR